MGAYKAKAVRINKSRSCSNKFAWRYTLWAITCTVSYRQFCPWLFSCINVWVCIISWKNFYFLRGPGDGCFFLWEGTSNFQIALEVSWAWSEVLSLLSFKPTLLLWAASFAFCLFQKLGLWWGNGKPVIKWFCVTKLIVIVCLTDTEPFITMLSAFPDCIYMACPKLLKLLNEKKNS